MIAAVRSAVSVNDPVLYVAFELAKREWKLALSAGFGAPVWIVTVAAGHLAQVVRVLAAGRQRFGVPATARVVSCYEAGRDGFWLHRALTRAGIANRVVDSASIEVNRRARRQKTDRIDARKLVQLLVRVCAGETDACATVRVPSAEAEAARHVSRERTALVRETTRLRNQISSWLATLGCRVSVRQRAQVDWWTRARDWADEPLPVSLQARIARTEARLAVVRAQLTAVEAQQVAATRAAAPTSPLKRLVQLKGVATTSAAVLLDEGLVWRDFQNRRQLGGLLGFAPLKQESGDTSRDQRISRAGNGRLRSTMVQLAWGWVHWQPESGLTVWYRATFGRGKRTRKIGIVALARKLLIALWRWATQGIVPRGAVLKTV